MQPVGGESTPGWWDTLMIVVAVGWCALAAWIAGRKGKR